MMFWYGNDTNVWGYALMTISMVLFWGLVIYGVIALLRSTAREDQPASATRPTPELLLADRLARGEINEEQYLRTLETLRGGSRPLTRS